MIYQWLDLIWIPIGLFVVQKHQRLWALGFFAASMLMMRMQVEVMHSIGYNTGFVNILKSDVFDRGMVVYSVFYTVYLILAYYSPNTRGMMLMAASISIFFLMFFISTLIMLL